MQETKPAVTEKCELEGRDKSLLNATFGFLGKTKF